MEDEKCRKKVDNERLFCRQSGLADLGTSGWGAPSTPQSATAVPNRTGMRETESTAGRSSIQVFCLNPVDFFTENFQVREDQEELLAQQDAGLDMLHDIVVRQKGMGQQIFREVG